MATVNKGRTFVSGETVTPAKLNELVDNATVTAIQTADISDSQITTAKMADSAVTNAKIASGVDASKLTTGTLPIARIADAAVTPAKLSQPYTLATAQNSTSGTSIDFTGIPSWADRVTVIFDGVSTSGTSSLCIQIGSGSLQLSGYSSSTVNQAGTASAATTALLVAANIAASATHCGNITLSMRGENVWVLSGVLVNTNGTSAAYSGGRVTLSGAIDRLRITTVSGSDTFDAGTINIAYEG